MGGFLNALSVLAPVAPAAAQADELRRQRAVQDEQLQRQRDTAAVQAQEAQQRIRKGNEPVIFGKPEWDAAQKQYSVLALDPVGKIVRMPVPGGESPEAEQSRRAKQEVATFKEVTGRDPTPEEQVQMAYSVLGVKMPTPVRERMKVSSPVPVDKSISSTGWATATYDLDTGAVKYYEPAAAQRGYIPRETTSRRFDPGSGMWIDTISVSRPTDVGTPLPAPGTPSAAPGGGVAQPSAAPASAAPSPAPSTGELTPAAPGLQRIFAKKPGYHLVTNPAEKQRVYYQSDANPSDLIPARTGVGGHVSARPIAGAGMGATAAPSVHRSPATATAAGGYTPPQVLRYPSMREDIRKRADSIASLQNNVVGMGNDPLWNYADLFDNPQTRRAINLALTATMNPTPTSVAIAGIKEALGTKFGITNWAQGTQSNNVTETRDQVQKIGGDRALELVDRLAELKGAIPTLRTITGASAAQASIAPLLQESPVINSSNSFDFRKRIALMERSMASALRADPTINQNYVNWLFKMADEADPMKVRAPQSGGNKSTPRGTKGAPTTAEQYLQSKGVK
jgi:hypothetical protein